MYGNASHPTGGQPPTPQKAGPGIVSPYRPPVMAPNLGTPMMPKTAPTTGYRGPQPLPAQRGPTGAPAPHFAPRG